MQWWEDYDQALGLAGAIQGTEDPALLAGSAALMLHAAGRRTLDAEAAAISAARHGLPTALGRITQDRLAGCVSKSLSDVAGKPTYGPFRAAAMKAAADDGATAMVDALVAAKVPYRDALAASARSYGIAKRDAVILARVIKSDPKSLASVAASQRSLLLWASRTANAETMALVAKATDEFIVDGKKRVVNRDTKGRFAAKGAAEAAPELTPQQAHDLKMAQRRQRQRERAKQKSAIPMAMATEQAQAQARPEAEQRQERRQAPEQRQERTAEQERLARIEQEEREELEELRELRELRRMRRGRRQRREANQARERAAQVESGYQMITEAVVREIDVGVNRAILGKLLDEVKTARKDKESRQLLKEKSDEFARIAAENVTSLLYDITDGSKGTTFTAEDPGQTAYRQEIKFLNVPVKEQVVLHVPLMFKPDGKMLAMDYPDEDDVFFMYTGKHLPQGKNIEELEPEDDGFTDLLFTAGFVNKLHSGALQKGRKHPLEVLSQVFDERAGYGYGMFLNAVMDQIAADTDTNEWHQIEDANGTPYRAMAKPGQVAVLGEAVGFDRYLDRYRPNMTDEEDFIYQDPHSKALDVERAERDIEEWMESTDAQLARAAMRGYAIYKMTRDSSAWDQHYSDYLFKFPSAFVGFDVDTQKTGPVVMQRLRNKNEDDGNDYTTVTRSDEVVHLETEDVMKEIGINPSEVIGMVTATPTVPMLGEWEDYGVDIQRGFYNQKDNYSGKATEKGQNWYRNHRIAGVQPLWSASIREKARAARSDVEQAEALVRQYSNGPDSALSSANSAITDLEDDVNNKNRKYSDPKYAQSLLGLMQIMTVADTIQNMQQE